MTKEKKNLIIAVIISVVVFSFLIFYINIQDFSLPEQIGGKMPFENCKVLAESCLDKDCPYYFLCDQAKFSCNVYDCGTYYGVLLKDKNNKTIVRKQPKPKKQKVREAINKCRGTFEILEKKQEGKKLKIKIQITTQGECQIQAFLARTKKGWQRAVFEKKDNYYNLVFNDLTKKDVLEIIAVGQGGVTIREK